MIVEYFIIYIHTYQCIDFLVQVFEVLLKHRFVQRVVPSFGRPEVWMLRLDEMQDSCQDDEFSAIWCHREWNHTQWHDGEFDLVTLVLEEITKLSRWEVRMKPLAVCSLFFQPVGTILFNPTFWFALIPKPTPLEPLGWLFHRQALWQVDQLLNLLQYLSCKTKIYPTP